MEGKYRKGIAEITFKDSLNPRPESRILQSGISTVRKNSVRDRRCKKVSAENRRRRSEKETFELLRTHTLHLAFCKINGHEGAHGRSTV